MAVSVLERVASGAVSATSVSVTTTVTPAAGDVAVLVLNEPAGIRTVSGVTGLGGTWTQVVGPASTSRRQEYWVGTGITSAGTVTVTVSSSGILQAEVYLVRGLVNPTTVAVNSASSSSVGSIAPAVRGENGQFVLEATCAGAGTLTNGEPVTPASGWTIHPIIGSSGTYQFGAAHRIPTESPATSHSVTSTLSDSSANRTATIVTLGTAAVPPTTINAGVAAETDVAPSASLTQGLSLNLGIATEADSAQPASTALALTLGRALEADSAPAATMLGPLSLHLGIATEADTALAAGAPLQQVLAGVANETDAALSAAFTPSVTIIGAAQAIDLRLGAGALTGSSQGSLIINDPTIDRVPNTITIAATGLDPGAVLTFTINGNIVWTDVADAEGELGLTTIDLPGDLLAGTYDLVMTTPANGTSSFQFTILENPEPRPADPATDAAPIPIPDTEGRWIFQDLLAGGLGSWVLPINPTSMTNPHFERNVTVGHTTSPAVGRYQVGEGAFIGKQWRLTGYCPDQTYYDQLVAYAGINRRFYVIDHRGRAWKVGVQALAVEPRKRQRDSVSDDNDWAGNWTLDLIIYDQTPVEV